MKKLGFPYILQMDRLSAILLQFGRLSVIGYRISDIGYRLSDIGYNPTIRSIHFPFQCYFTNHSSTKEAEICCHENPLLTEGYAVSGVIAGFILAGATALTYLLNWAAVQAQEN